jgi:small subunit ribosomal protein S18
MLLWKLILERRLIVMPNVRKERGNRDNYDKADGKSSFRARRAKRKVCSFCVDKIEDINYKDIARIRKFVSERGKILPRRISGNCAKHQRRLTIAIKRARHIALLPYTSD